MKVLFIGDIVGNIGRKLVKNYLPNIVDKNCINIVIANGENAAGGFGITENTAKELFDYGVNVITTGNHVWDKKEIIGYISQQDRILRPLNYPPDVPGFSSVIYPVSNGFKVGVINLSGRIFMYHMDCPFRAVNPEVERIKKVTKVIIIDFHAEATSEKVAFGYYMDGKVSAVIGTHTHVQTADERILPNKTAYITDVGMTGPYESVIGVKTNQVIEKFLTMMPKKFDTAKGKGILSGVIVSINDDTGIANDIQRISIVED